MFIWMFSFLDKIKNKIIPKWASTASVKNLERRWQNSWLVIPNTILTIWKNDLYVHIFLPLPMEEGRWKLCLSSYSVWVVSKSRLEDLGGHALELTLQSRKKGASKHWLKWVMAGEQNSKCPVYAWVPFQECVHKSIFFTSPTKSRYPTKKIGYIRLYCNRLITLFTQIHKKQTQKKENILILQYSTLKSTAVYNTTGLESSEQARRVTDWRREKRWEKVELKDCQQ